MEFTFSVFKRLKLHVRTPSEASKLFRPVKRYFSGGNVCLLSLWEFEEKWNKQTISFAHPHSTHCITFIGLLSVSIYLKRCKWKWNSFIYIWSCLGSIQMQPCNNNRLNGHWMLSIANYRHFMQIKMEFHYDCVRLQSFLVIENIDDKNGRKIMSGW